jgi:DUF917 family protein
MSTVSVERLTSLGEQDVEDLAVGCTILAGGGGGDPRVGLMMTLSAIRDLGEAKLVQLEDLADEDYLFASGMIGAPTVMMEKMPSGFEGAVIKETIEARSGRQVTAMMPLEMGGINGLLPVAWAIRAGLPLVDGDFMGRAFPELQMCTPHLYDMPAWPCVLVDERSQAITFEPRSNVWLERLARNAVAVLGGGACSGLYPMTARDARRPIISGTVSNAVRVGRALREGHKDPFEALGSAIETYRLISGKVIEVERRTEGGFVRGGAVIEGTDQDAGRLVRIEFQNENLIALEDGEAIATVPDIITLLDRHTARGIVTEHIRYGQRVVLAVFPAPEQWRTPAGLTVVGPRAFGYEFDFVPVEERHAQAT